MNTNTVSKSISETHPHLIEEWDAVRNEKTPYEVKASDKNKAWWVCAKNIQHKWEAIIENRTRLNSGCPYCSGTKVIPGENDLETLHPDVASEWSERNSKLPSEVSPGSHDKYYWECSEGHIWTATVRNRTRRGDGCSVCSGKKILTGYNDLATQFPHIAEEWSPNNENPSSEVSPESHFKAEWICSEGHKWKASVGNRTRSNQRCPYCTGRKTITGKTDIATTHPELASEWNDERDVRTVSAGSNIVISWKCAEGNHVWKTSPNNRTKEQGTGCPKCSNRISQAEQEIYDYIVSMLPSTVEIIQSDMRVIPPYELDIYIPEKNMAIEFNGLYWHTEKQGKDKWYHYNKWKRSREQEIELMTIWEDDWKRRPDLIKGIIKNKIGTSGAKKISPARRTSVVPVSTKEAEEFYLENHIRGHIDGNHYGLITEEESELIALSTWETDENNNSIHLKRNAVLQAVQEEAEHLLSHMIREYSRNNQTEIVAFSENDISDEKLYSKLGFTRDEEIDPEFSYVLRQKRVGHLKSHLGKLRNDPKILWEEEITERELATINGLERIWGCGKTRWILKL